MQPEQNANANPFAEPIVEEIKIAPRSKRRKRTAAPVVGIPHKLDELFPDHDLTKRYQPKYIGKGGENLVYQAKNHQGVVIKAQKLPLAKSMAWNKAHGLETGDDSQAVEELRTRELLEQRERQQEMLEVFGDQVLKQRYFVMQVPVGEAVREELHESPNLYHVQIPEKADAGWTIVSIQERAKCLADSRRLSVGGANLEKTMQKNGTYNHPAMRDLYCHVTDSLLSAERAEQAEVDAEDLGRLMKGTPFEPLLKKALADPDLAEKLADFQKKAVEFSVKNEEILDILGTDNVVFYHDEHGMWTYQIIDGLYPFDRRILQKGREALLKIKMGAPVDHLEENAFLQAMGYVRVINSLGKLLRTGAYIDFTPEQLKDSDFSYGDVMFPKR